MSGEVCRFCNRRRPMSVLFVWRSGLYECLDLISCESASRLTLVKSAVLP